HAPHPHHAANLRPRSQRPPHPHRRLPPFPTRRSSDLVHLDEHEIPEKLLKRLKALYAALEDDPSTEVPEEQLKTMSRSLIFTHTDRKSTRLNSSHVSISYAVFCLKKKKQQSARGNAAD